MMSPVRRWGCRPPQVPICTANCAPQKAKQMDDFHRPRRTVGAAVDDLASLPPPPEDVGKLQFAHFLQITQPPGRALGAPPGPFHDHDVRDVSLGSLSAASHSAAPISMIEWKRLVGLLTHGRPAALCSLKKKSRKIASRSMLYASRMRWRPGLPASHVVSLRRRAAGATSLGTQSGFSSQAMLIKSQMTQVRPKWS